MNGADIASVLEGLRDFGGVVMPDKLRHCKMGKLYILNSQPYPGQHWLALDLRASHAEFFDSFGHSLDKYGFRDIATPITTYNSMQLQQDTSDVCGGYCIMYAVYKLNGYTMQDFLQNFTYDDLLANDSLLLYWLAGYDGQGSLIPWTI